MAGPDQSSMKRALGAYVDRMNAGDAEGLRALFAADATIEDPVGTEPKSGDQISAWFADAVAYRTRIYPVGPVRGSRSNEAALAFEVEFSPPGNPRLRIRSVDVCSFDHEGLIVSLRAFWGEDDISLAADDSIAAAGK